MQRESDVAAPIARGWGQRRGRGLLTAGLTAVVAFVAGACAHASADPGASSVDIGEGRATLRIAAASDLTATMPALEASFEAAHPEVDVVAGFGSSGQFVTQISNGAPFDVFLAADESYPQTLVEEGVVTPDQPYPYAVGQLVLWVPTDSPVAGAESLEQIAGRDLRHLAIANPAHAPYGVAAMGALTAAGIADSLGRRLVLGENVAQAAEFAATGAADAAIIARSLAQSPPLAARGRAIEIPSSLYRPLKQTATTLHASVPAEEFRVFLTGPEGRAILAGGGFGLPPVN